MGNFKTNINVCFVLIMLKFHSLSNTQTFFRNTLYGREKNEFLVESDSFEYRNLRVDVVCTP